MRAAGFEKNGAAGVGQQDHQMENIFLQQWFAPGDFDQRAIVKEDGVDDFA